MGMFPDFNDKTDWGMIFIFSVLGLMLLAVTSLLVGSTYDRFYFEPTASDRANEFCKATGFDQYKSFSRVGLFSKVPVGIKCEYSERYIDLGVRTNGG